MKLKRFFVMMSLVLSPLVLMAVGLTVPDAALVLGRMLLTEGQGPAAQLGGAFLLAWTLLVLTGVRAAILYPPWIVFLQGLVLF